MVCGRHQSPGFRVKQGVMVPIRQGNREQTHENQGDACKFHADFVRTENVIARQVKPANCLPGLLRVAEACYSCAIGLSVNR